MPPTQSKTIDEAAEQITRDENSWSDALYTPVTTWITYAFRSDNGEEFNSTQIDAANLVMDLWSDVANIAFVRVGTGNTGPDAYSNAATILFGNYSNLNDGASGYETGDPSSGDVGDVDEADIWMNTGPGGALFPEVGNGNFEDLLHEVGHAIGLQHPGDYNAGPGKTFHYGSDAAYIEDSTQYTVMSYFSPADTGANHQVEIAPGQTQFIYASTPLLDDIAAAQRLYGANMSTRTGDTIYGFYSNADRAVFDLGNDPTKQAVFAIWDAGGHDTLDFSLYSQDQVINLTPGSFSSTGALTFNVAIAEGAVIEDARGGSGDDIITGNDWNNEIWGGGGNDTIDGGDGDDTLHGGIGDDTLRGSFGKDTLYGDIGNDTLDGGTAADTLIGGIGDDRYILADMYTAGQGYYLDSVVEKPGEGTDTISIELASNWSLHIHSYQVPDNFENCTVGGTLYAFDLTGNDLDNVLTGNDAVNTLDGGDGDDWLEGRAGDDTLNGGKGNDTLNGGKDDDTLNGGLGNDSLWGGDGNDTLNGDVGDDKLNGQDGDDVLNGGIGNDTLNGGKGNDTLNGGDDSDTLDGDDGYDVLAGGKGDDTYILTDVSPHSANGVQYPAAYDRVVENAGEGTDTIEVGAATYASPEKLVKFSSYSFADNPNIENGTVIGNDDFDLTGNNIGNILTGNEAKNTLTGLGGNDTLDGHGGLDKLVGGDGDDTYMLNDVTVAANSTDPLHPILVYDTIVEDSGLNSGTQDTVNVGQQSLTINGNAFATKSYTLADNVEIGIVTGAAAFDLVGNAGDNTLMGNAAANTLSGSFGKDAFYGGLGFDTLIGGDGDDTYYLDDVTLAAGPVNPSNPTLVYDTIVEGNGAGSGTDTVRVGQQWLVTNGNAFHTTSYTMADNVENGIVTGLADFNLVGNASDNKLTGNDWANTLSGGIGNDTLDGGAGLDTLIGGDNNDTYILNDVILVAIDPANPRWIFDSVVEDNSANSGTDTVMVGRQTATYQGQKYAISSYILPDNVENGTVTGTGAFDIVGNAGRNTITGNAAKNTLSGGDNNDTLIGNGGGDTFDGGHGNDMMVLWHGVDTVVFHDQQFGNDTVKYFEAGLDVLAFDHSIFADFNDMMKHTAQVGFDAVISFDKVDTITLLGVDKTHLTSADFMLA